MRYMVIVEESHRASTRMYLIFPAAWPLENRRKKF